MRSRRAPAGRRRRRPGGSLPSILDDVPVDQAHHAVHRVEQVEQRVGEVARRLRVEGGQAGADLLVAEAVEELADHTLELVTVDAKTPLSEVAGTLKKNAISQVPVLDGERVCGIIAENDVLNHLLEKGHGDDAIDEDEAKAASLSRRRPSLKG